MVPRGCPSGPSDGRPSACARQDGVHDCRSEEAIPTPSYPVPSLSVGGEMDGVVRVSRMAEAWYTQQAVPQHVVKLVPGANRAFWPRVVSVGAFLLEHPSNGTYQRFV